MADQTHVDIDALDDFGKRTLDQTLKHYLAGMAAVEEWMSVGAVIGMVGTIWAQMLKDCHSDVLERSRSFASDLSLGLESLGGGARAVAANYRAGDLSQAEAVNDVLAAFNPPAGSRTVAGEKVTLRQEWRQAVTNAHKEFGAEARISLWNIAAEESEGPFTDDLIREHVDKYGEYERWRPLDPNAPKNDPTGP